MTSIATLSQTYYLVYKITNLLNGNFYIGVHKTKNKNDSYMGSGHALRKAIKKYGKENFKKEILFELSSEQEMYDKEREVVVVGEGCYNLINGGGFPLVFTDVIKNKIGAANAIHQKGEGNSQYGKIWINNGISTTRIKKDECIPIGYVKGRLASKKPPKTVMYGSDNPNFGKKFVNDGINNFLIDKNLPIPEGYTKGRVMNFNSTPKNLVIHKGEKNHKYGEKWYTNGKESVSLKSTQTIPPGFYPGRAMPTNWIWITNGQQNLKLKKELPMPDGFWNGKTGRKKMTASSSKHAIPTN